MGGLNIPLSTMVLNLILSPQYQGLLNYEPIYRAYLKQLFETVIEDGVGYVETRINFLEPVHLYAFEMRRWG